MPGRSGYLFLLAVIAAMPLLGSCAGTRSPELASQDLRDAPSLSELDSLLRAELERLGVDPARVVAQAPSGPESRSLDLALENIDHDGPALGSELPSAVVLHWTERFTGDFNQDGQVSVQDLAPIGQNFRRQVAYDDPSLHQGFEHWPSGDPSGLGAPNWRLARVDGIPDGVISVSDLTAIGLHFGERLDGYVIRRGINRGGGTIEWDAEPLDLGAGELLSVSRAAFSAAPGEPFRFSVQIELAESQFAQYFTVQACDSASQTYGAESDSIAYSPNPGVDIEAPIWDDTVGLSKLLPGDQRMTLYFGSASDVQSPPVSYRVYYAKGDAAEPQAAFDFDNAAVLTVSQSPVVIQGLPNMEYWRAVVRAVDSAAQPNEEQNLLLRGAKIGAADIYPPDWQGQAGLLDLYYGDGQALLVCARAIDSQQDQFGLWESGPVIYRVYHGTGTLPDLESAAYTDFTDQGLQQCVLPLTGLDTTADHWFCVRVRDSAAAPNEDSNTVCLIGQGISAITLPAPLAGPGVPAGAETSGPPSFAFAPGLNDYRLVTQPEVAGDHWASLWRLANGNYVSQGDFHLANTDDAPDFSLHGASLDLQGKLKLLFVKESVFSDHFTICEYRQSLGQSTDYTLEGDYEVNLCGYNAFSEPFCIFDAFDTGVASGQTNFKFYMSGLPLTSSNLLHDTSSGIGPQIVNLWDWGYSRLSDGRIGVMLRITNYLSGEASHQLLRSSTSSFSSEEYQLQDDRLVGLMGNGVPEPLVVTESNDAEGKIQHLGDGQSNLSIGALPAMVLKRSQVQASTVEAYMAALELESSSFYGDQNEIELQAVLLHSAQGDQKLPLFLEAGATSFRPLAVLDDKRFVLSYYVPGTEGGGQERHLILSFNQ